MGRVRASTAGRWRSAARGCGPVVDGSAMPTRVACAALLLCACARHVAPAPGQDRTVVSGVPVVFGSEQDLPKGTRVLWDFGDGTPPADGPRVEHAFPRAGAYRVTETVVGGRV